MARRSLGGTLGGIADGDDGRTQRIRARSIFRTGAAASINSRDAKQKAAKPRQLYENTYRLEPVTRFKIVEAQQILRTVLHDMMTDELYHPVTTGKHAQDIAMTIRNQIRDLKYDRYKVAVLVNLGPIRFNSITIASECLSDPQRDYCISFTLQTTKMFANAVVFITYTE